MASFFNYLRLVFQNLFSYFLLGLICSISASVLAQRPDVAYRTDSSRVTGQIHLFDKAGDQKFEMVGTTGESFILKPEAFSRLLIYNERNKLTQVTTAITVSGNAVFVVALGKPQWKQQLYRDPLSRNFYSGTSLLSIVPIPSSPKDRQEFLVGLMADRSPVINARKMSFSNDEKKLLRIFGYINARHHRYSAPSFSLSFLYGKSSRNYLSLSDLPDLPSLIGFPTEPPSGSRQGVQFREVGNSEINDVGFSLGLNFPLDIAHRFDGQLSAGYLRRTDLGSETDFPDSPNFDAMLASRYGSQQILSIGVFLHYRVGDFRTLLPFFGLGMNFEVPVQQQNSLYNQRREGQRIYTDLLELSPQGFGYVFPKGKAGLEFPFSKGMWLTAAATLGVRYGQEHRSELDLGLLISLNY